MFNRWQEPDLPGLKFSWMIELPQNDREGVYEDKYMVNKNLPMAWGFKIV